MDFARSAEKHGITHDDTEYAVQHYVYESWLSDEPPFRVLYLGPSRSGNFLEVVVVELDDGRELVIHAMNMQPRYESLLEEVLSDE